MWKTRKLPPKKRGVRCQGSGVSNSLTRGVGGQGNLLPRETFDYEHR